jgi:hypothetical protein
MAAIRAAGHAFVQHSEVHPGQMLQLNLRLSVMQESRRLKASRVPVDTIRADIRRRYHWKYKIARNRSLAFNIVQLAESESVNSL